MYVLSMAKLNCVKDPSRGGRICPTSYSVYVNRNEIQFKIVKNRSINIVSKLRGKGKENDKRARRQSFLWL
jgi:hypothetical protein